jgi:hypothetical protein
MSLFKSLARLFSRERRRRDARRFGRPQLEGLEDRQLMTVGLPFGVDGGVFPAFGSANASSTNGMSVAVWVREFTPSDHDIRAQLYSASGAKVGGEIFVENGTLDDVDPSVAMDAQGNFVVTWTQIDASGQGNIVARRFNNQGAARDGQPITVINSFRDEFDSDVAMDAAGNFVVSYTRAFGATDLDVQARWFNSAGALLGTVFVADTIPFDERESSVATTPNGGFVVAYTRGDVLESFNPDVLLSRFDAQGNRLTTNGNINVSSSFLDERDPDVAVDAFGNMVVAYQEFTGGTYTIQAKRVTASGLVGVQMAIATNSAFLSFDPAVAVNRFSGSFVVAYSQDSQDGNITRAEVAEVSGTTNTVVQRQTLFDANDDSPAVSMGPNGNYFVTYTSGDFGVGDTHVFGRRGQRP